METGGGRIGILHVISGLGLGGAERMLLWSARYHDRDLVRMGVVSLMSDGELADGEVRTVEFAGKILGLSQDTIHAGIRGVRQ